MKRGFTLIEVLVVVLIAGILAAIALPRYQAAVDKSRLAKVMSLNRHIKDAQEVYYMSTGSYSDIWSALGVDAPGGSVVRDCIAGGHPTQCIGDGEWTWYCSLQSHGLYTYCQIAGVAEVGVMLDRATSMIAGRNNCLASSVRGHRACVALGGVLVTETGSTHYYKLP